MKKWKCETTLILKKYVENKGYSFIRMERPISNIQQSPYNVAETINFLHFIIINDDMLSYGFFNFFLF